MPRKNAHKVKKSEKEVKGYHKADAKGRPGVDVDEDEGREGEAGETGAERAEEDAHPQNAIDEIVIDDRLCKIENEKRKSKMEEGKEGGYGGLRSS